MIMCISTRSSVFWNSVLQVLCMLISNLLFNVLFLAASGSPEQGEHVCRCAPLPANSWLLLQNHAKKLKLTYEAQNKNQRRDVRNEGARTANADANHACGRKKNNGAEGETGRLCCDRRDFLLISQRKQCGLKATRVTLTTSETV